MGEMKRDMEQDHIQSGRITTLEAIYALHGAYILRYLNRLVGTKCAEDLLQDTFVQALSHIDKLNALESPRAWLFRVAYHLAMNEYRRKKMVHDVPLDQLVEASSDEDPRLPAMRDAISKLDDMHREVVMLRWYDQLSYEEISQVLDISVGTVRSRLHHSLGKLRMRMDVELGVDP
jgi:RNA polymerase sigma-70 factor (ECF subfamily)